MQEPSRRPEVTLVRSSLPPAPACDGPGREPHRRAWLALAVTASGLLLAGTSTGQPPPPLPLQAELVVRAQELTVSQSGVLVLPLELRNGGPPADVGAQVYAEPVTEDAVVQAPNRLQAGDRRSFVALVTPDCRLLRPGSPIEFRATVLLRLNRGRDSRDVVADLAGAAGVRDLVTRMCG